ncbi:MAG: hypothetical protein GWP04_10145 [Gammaproteobacteria bacterium]|nr:hypothetical protein [Gammaproteobacteria bacterium]
MEDDDRSLDDLLAELADVQQRLIELSSDAFAERFELRGRQYTLREQTATFSRDWDLDRSSEELLAELASLRERLHQLDRQKIDVATRYGGGTNTQAAVKAGVPCSSTRASMLLRGAGDLHARIGRIKAILTDRVSNLISDLETVAVRTRFEERPCPGSASE